MRLKFLSLVLSVSALFSMVSSTSVSYAASTCTREDIIHQLCNTQTSNDGQEVGVGISIPGDNGSSGSGSGPSGSGSDEQSDTGGPPEAGHTWLPPGAPPRLTLSDIAHFRPAQPRALMEPNGWTIAKLPTNFYSIDRQHDQPGRVLNFPITVRFVPVSYHWNYGDSTSNRLSAPGTTWQALGRAAFSPTPTSHVYQETGNYRITLSVSYAPYYRFDDLPWIRIDGLVHRPANDLHIRVGTMQTYLVAEHCAENPTAPGCY